MFFSESHSLPKSASPSLPKLSQQNISEDDIKPANSSENNLQSVVGSVGEESIEGKFTKESKHVQIITSEQWGVSAYFAAVMRKITEILAQHVKVEDLVSFLHFQCHPLNHEALYVDKHILQHISNVSEVMESLVPDYINYMETGFLEAIVESFEIKEAQEVLQEYHYHYPHLRQLTDMPDPVPDDRLDLTQRKQLRAKCDGNFESASTNDVKRIQMSIEGATGIDHRFLTPAQHSEGSLIFTFLISESVSSIFQELCDEDLEILAGSGIVELQINDCIISDIQKYCPNRMRSSAHSTSVSSAGQVGTTAKGFDSFIEQRKDQFSRKEKTQLTGFLNAVPKSTMEEVCTDSFLQQLVPHMTDWRKLAPRLGIGERRVEELTRCYPDVGEQRYMVFHEWKQIDPGSASYGNLVACLLAHAPFDFAEAALSKLTQGKIRHSIIHLIPSPPTSFSLLAVEKSSESLVSNLFSHN